MLTLLWRNLKVTSLLISTTRLSITKATLQKLKAPTLTNDLNNFTRFQLSVKKGKKDTINFLDIEIKYDEQGATDTFLFHKMWEEI